METIADTHKLVDIYTNLHLISAKPKQAVHNAKNLSIVIVDADGVDFEMLAKHLKLIQRYNVSAIRAHSLADAAKIVASDRAELVLLGNSHEVSAGDDALAIYAELKSEVPVLFIAGETTDDGFDRDMVNYIDLDNLTPAVLELTIRSALHIFKLEQKLEQTTTRLNEVKCAKDNFFAHVSHDLKTPLNAILGYSEALMLGAFGPLDNSNVADTLTIINRAGTNLLGAINELIVQVSSVDYLKNPLWEVTDINDIISTAINQVDVFADCRKQKITKQFDALLCLTECDSNAVMQAVTSVLANAIKSSPELTDISVSTKNCGKHVEIEICGQNIALIGALDALPNVQCKELEQSADTAKKDAGIGLSIIRSVVDMHHGHLEVSDTDESGTLVKISLPRKRPQSQN